MSRAAPTAQLASYIRDCGPWVYHLTDASNLLDIASRGLVPSGSDSEYDRAVLRPDHVYLCSEQVAIYTLADGLADWGDAALAVDLRRVDVTRLAADEDYWRGELMDAGVTDLSPHNVLRLRPGIDDLAMVLGALRDNGTCSYRGVIAPTALRVAFIAPRPDLPQLAPLRQALLADPLFGSGLTSPAALAKIGYRRSELG